MQRIYDWVCGKKNSHHLPFLWAILIGLLVAYLSWFTKNRLQSLPPALNIKDLPQHNRSFIAERAFQDLRIITGFGTRPTGSHANEILSIEFLKSSLSQIKKSAHPNQKIESDIQVTSGAVWNKIYRNVQNFIVRLAGSDKVEDSLLLK